MPKEKAKQKKQKQNKKQNNNFIKILVLFLIASLIIYILYTLIILIIKPTDKYYVNNGTIYIEENQEGYIIREETVIKDEAIKHGILQIKTQGEKVAKNSAIFRYYKSDEEEIKKDITEINKKIQDVLLSDSDIFSSDIKALETQIEDKLYNFKFKNDIQEIIEYKKDINNYLSRKAEIEANIRLQDSQIKDLMIQKSNLEEQLEENTEYIKSPTSGIISYRIDEKEELLKPTNFENLNKSDLEKLNLKTGQIVATSDKMAKIVNNFEAYIVIITNSEEAQKSEVGDKIYLRLSTQDEIPASIEYIKQENDENLIVFKINNCIEKLIDYRKISVDIIWTKSNGLKIPKSCIIYDEGNSYVIKTKAGYKEKVIVKILQQNKKYCIIDNYKSDELLSLGYDTKEINNLEKINIYDEILLNPDVNQI